MYYNSFAYDANGNITQQIRLSQSGQKIEDMVYRYKTNSSGKLLRNRLYHINDEVDASDWADDIDDMGVFENNPLLIETANNYSYDEEGRLIKDTQEGIKEIVWRVDGKVRAVIFDSLSQKPHLLFDYDAFGRRIAKHLYDNQSEVLMKTTYYLRDASGNQLSTYVHEVLNEQTHFTLKELHLYGSSHLGMVADSVNLFTHTPSTHINTILGLRYYNLTNHLGNVLTTLSDIKIPLSDDNQTVSGYDAAIVNIYDYSPFGVYLDGRTIESKYMPFGFNGMQRDDEMKGKGNSYDFGARMYDSRLGRFLSLDNLAREFAYQSPYIISGCSPLMYIDVNGDFKIVITQNAKEVSGAQIKTERFERIVADLAQYVNDNPRVLEVIYQQTLFNPKDTPKDKEAKLNQIRKDCVFGEGPTIYIDVLDLYAAQCSPSHFNNGGFAIDFSFLEFLENFEGTELQNMALDLIFAGTVLHEYTHYLDRKVNRGEITGTGTEDLGKQGTASKYHHRGQDTEVAVQGTYIASSENIVRSNELTIDNNSFKRVSGGWFLSIKEIDKVLKYISNSGEAGKKQVLPKDMKK